MRITAALAPLMLTACMSAANTPDTTGANAPEAPVPTSAPPMARMESDPDKIVKNGGVMVPGWMGRLDPRAVSQGRTLADLKFATMGSGQHVTGGPAAIFWNPGNSASGNFTATATFTQMKPATHPEGYGLLFGGENLTAANQSYMYFLVRQDGKFLINHRASDTEVHKIVDWTANPAVRVADASGKSTNALSVTVGRERISFRVNATEVHSVARATAESSGMRAQGIVGLRVNHNLDVHVDGFAVTRQ